MASYRFIGTYSNDSGNLSSWAGGSSSAAFTVTGSTTAFWGTNFQVSAFNMTPGSGASDVLNAGGSPYGTDMLNLSDAIAANPTGWSEINVPAFNWNGNPATPGFNCLTETVSINSTTGMVLTDTLDSTYWGEVRDYEMKITSADNPHGEGATVTGFQHVNLDVAGIGGMNGVLNVQRGSFNFTGADYGLVGVFTANDGWSSSTFTFQAATIGGEFYVGSGTQIADYASNPLVTDGTGTVCDIYDQDGGNNFILTNNASATLNLVGGTTAMAFAGGNVTADTGDYLVHSAGTFGNDVVLNASSTGAATIYANDVSTVTTITNFVLGRDTLDMVQAGFGSPTLTNTNWNGSAAVAITDGSGHGAILAGLSVASLSGHSAPYTAAGVEHVLIH